MLEHITKDGMNTIMNFQMNKVTIIATIYNSYPQIISSLICQTHKEWHLFLIHDGPNSTGLKKMVEDANDNRITYIEMEERKNVWGHNLRQWALEEIAAAKMALDSEFIVISNADNYYCPIFLEQMLKGFKPGIKVTYCSAFLHSYLTPQPNGNHHYGPIASRLELGYIDCGSIMVRKEVACDVGWRSMLIYSDWEYINDIIQKYGKKSFNIVLGTLFIHN
jgi:hypothetical protein